MRRGAWLQVSVVWLQNAPQTPVFPYHRHMQSDTIQQRPAWHYIAGAWLAIALFDASQTVFVMRAEGMHHAWATLFFVRLASWLVWALATPCAYALVRRFPLPAPRVLPWLVHAAACIGVGAITAGWVALLESTLDPWLEPHGPPGFIDVWQGNFVGSLLGDFILYGVILVVRAVFEARERLARQEADRARLNAMLAQAQLAALRLQLEPHFMFNSLNAITGLVREGRNDEAVTMIAAMGELLRRVTDRSERQLVALEEEAAFLGKYLDIQGVRFADRLRCRLEIPDGLKTARVPDLILQPLVENAIKHGIARQLKGGEVRVSAESDGITLTLNVYNDGPALRDDYQPGIGLNNARRRLAGLYGDASALTLRNQAPGGVLASISLPYRTT